MSETNLRRRSEIPDRYKWRLEDMYAYDELWEADVKKAMAFAEEIGQSRESVCDSASALLAFFHQKDELDIILSLIEVYAKEKSHQDTAVAKYQAYASKADDVLVYAACQLAFAEPKILSIPEDTLAAWYEEEPELCYYKRVVDEIRRKKTHILSAEEERILAEAGNLKGCPSQIFSMFNNADVKFPYITNVLGDRIRITHGNFISFLMNTDRSMRKQVFCGVYDAYRKMGHTLAATYIAHLKQDYFFAKVRNYPSTRAMKLDGGNIPESVYDNLIQTVHNHLPAMHRYMELRKKLLGVSTLHMYDIYVPIVFDVGRKHPFDEGKHMVTMGVAPMGAEYAEALSKGMESGWIDVYENENKRSGAYSWGAYGAHPYVLLNYNNDLDSVYTLAHEMGHAMHTYYSNKNNKVTYADYKIFVAEVASTCNECLLTEFLLDTTGEETEKRFLINHYLEEFRTTVFRQTLFAEFEYIAHTRLANGESLTMEDLNRIYYDLNVQYYGPAMYVDEEIAYEWMRIPHFYDSFYVYQYATGFSTAVAFSKIIQSQGQEAADIYIEKFLSGGSSKDPIDLLKDAGVDLSTPEPIELALKAFEEALENLISRTVGTL